MQMPTPYAPTVLCLIPAQRWCLDALESALAAHGVSLWVRCCDPALESASVLLTESLERDLIATLYCDTLDRFANLGQADNVTEFLQTLRDADYPVVGERFDLGGPFDDEAISTTPTNQLVRALLPARNC